MLEGASTVSSADGIRPPADHQHLLDAVIAELAVTNPGSITLAAVARRAGVDERDVKKVWANTPELLTAALMSYARRNLPIPDTGTLRGDLLGYAKSYAAEVNSPKGRRLFDALIATPRDWDVTGWRSALYAARSQRTSAAIQRAVERGEVRADVNPVGFFDLLAAGLCIPLQFYDRPITDTDCEFVVDTLLNGVIAHH